MAKSQEWFEVPHRSYGATTAIYQVGQVITDPLDLDSALFRNGSFNGMPSHELSQTIRQRKALTVTYSKSASPFEVITDHVTVIEGARIDGKGVPILWQVLEEERIYRNDTLLKAVIQEEEITRHLARPDRRKPLYLVTDVIKVQEIIPEYYDPGMLHPSKNPFIPPYSSVFENPFPPPSPNFAPSGRFAASSASEDLHLPVGFDGRKHGKPFVWKYKLECIDNPEDVESVSAERYLPSQALSDRDHTTWIVMILNFLLRWIWSPSRQKPTPIGGAGDSTILSARPITLEWRVEHENLTPDPVAEPNGTLAQMNIYGSAYGIPPPPHMRLRNFSRARTYNTSPSPDQSDDEYPVRRRRVARSVTRSPTRWHGRRGRGTSEPTEPVDFSDSEPKNILIPYRRRARPGIRAKFDNSSESIAQKPDQFIPGTTEATVGPSSVETISHPYGLENSELAGQDSKNTGIQESLGEAQAVGNCAGDSETASEPKAEHLEDRSSTKAPQISANWTVPVLNSPPSGLPHAEYDVFDSESADLANSLSQGDDAIKEGKKWFDDAEYMKKVNKFFEASRSGRPSERAKIAVLDTGLDFDHLLLRPFIESKRLSREHSLDFTLEPNIPVKGDSVGHGTHCTHLILKTCETAEVYVAKVFKKKKADQHTAMCVAKSYRVGHRPRRQGMES
ncbi:hypothetical protein F4776DRAFT_603935 [Hypoxylon sp. NC0597]|nr:hypothetical protein F4776DRAFT_603935 [Hypoxylon sp. NC0597]